MNTLIINSGTNRTRLERRWGFRSLVILLVLLLALGRWCPAAQAQPGTAQANGLTIAYESLGDPRHETILLIGGTGSQLTTWPDALCQELVKRGYRVVRFDNRDAGLSTKLDAAGRPDWPTLLAALGAGQPVSLAYTLADMARDAVGLLDALGIKKAHLVGASMGGMIAQLVATSYPQRTRSLTSLMASDGKPGLPLPAKPEVMAKAPAPLPPAMENDTAAVLAFAVQMRQVLGSPGYPTDEKILRAQATRDLRRAHSPAGYQRQGAAALVESFHDRRAQLRTLRVPTVVVHGAADPLVPVAAGQDVAATIPGAELRVIPGMGHEVPAQLVPTVAEAIAAAARAPRLHSH